MEPNMTLATLHPVSAYVAYLDQASAEHEALASDTWPSLRLGTGASHSNQGFVRSLGGTFYTYLGTLLADETSEDIPVFSIDVPEALSDLRESLGLSTADLARVLRVSRQAIYDWTAGKPVKAENRQRLRALRDLAAAWRAHGAGPLGELRHQPIADQPSLLALLAAAPLDLVALRARLDALAALHRQAVAARPPSAEELAARFALRPLSAQTQRRTLRTFSGSRRS